MTQALALKTHLSTRLRRSTLLALLGVLVGVAGLRLFRPMLLPMFFDEGLHLVRAEQVLAERTLLIDTTGGKYLQVWLVALFLPLAGDPLLVARLVAAGVGLLGGAGCYLLARRLFDRAEVALVAAIFYAIAPYPLLFDRMALVDGVLSVLGIWILLFSLGAVQRGEGAWWPALALGLTLGMAAATRLNGVIFLAFPLLAAWLWRDEAPLRRSLPRVFGAGLLMGLWLVPSFLDFGPQFEVALDHAWFGPGSGGGSLAARLGANFGTIAATLWIYLTPPLLLLALAEAGRGLWRGDKRVWLLALAAAVTLGFFLVTAESHKFYPRYLNPAFPFLLILAVPGLFALAGWLQQRGPWAAGGRRGWLLAGLVLLAGLPALYFDARLLTDPPRAPWSAIDRWQYIDGWPAGYGITDATAYLRRQVDELGTIIVVKRAPKPNRAGVWRYYLAHPNIIFTAINLKEEDPQELIEALHSAPAPVFVALDRPEEDRYAVAFTDGPFAPYSQLVATFPRPGGASRIEVYRLTPSP